MPMTVPWRPWAMGTRENFGFPGAITSKSLKNRALRAPKTTCWTTKIAVPLTDVKSEDPAKMTHSISDFLRRLRAQEYAKNMPMNRPGGLRMWAEAKFLYS